MVAAGAGPAALLFGGGRASLGGEPLDDGGARRYRELTAGRAACRPTSCPARRSPGRRRRGVRRGFASAPAPQGTGRRAGGRRPGRGRRSPRAAAGRPARVRVRRARRRGTVRVIAIDNAAGRLAGGPDGPQAQWLRDVMEQARGRGIPWSWSAARRWTARSAKPRADDADRGARAARRPRVGVRGDRGRRRPARPALRRRDEPTSVASRPAPPRRSPLFQSSTLGYAPAQKRSTDELDEDESRQSGAALLMLDVGVDRIDPGTGVAPVAPVRAAARGRRSTGLTRASRSAGRRALRHRHRPGPRRFLMSPSPDEPLQPASPGTGLYRPADRPVPVLSWTCATVVPSDMTFASSNPQIARFVAVRPGRRGEWRPPRGRPRRAGTSSTTRAASSARSRSGRSTSP